MTKQLMEQTDTKGGRLSPRNATEAHSYQLEDDARMLRALSVSNNRGAVLAHINVMRIRLRQLEKQFRD